MDKDKIVTLLKCCEDDINAELAKQNNGLSKYSYPFSVSNRRFSADRCSVSFSIDSGGQGAISFVFDETSPQSDVDKNFVDFIDGIKNHYFLKDFGELGTDIRCEW